MAKTSRIMVRITDEEREKLEALAREENRPVSQMSQVLISQAMKAYQPGRCSFKEHRGK